MMRPFSFAVRSLSYPEKSGILDLEIYQIARTAQMRFRKRISLGKGASINLSKSGVSFTGGVKGASVNIGSKGTFLNTSIPGTGLYDRKKIGGSSSKKSSTSGKASGVSGSGYERTAQEYAQNISNLQVSYIYHDDGSITFKDPSGHEITNPALIREIKASPEYKAELARMSEERVRLYNEQMDQIINIQRLTRRVYTTEAWTARIKAMKPKQYEYEAFTEPKPLMGDVLRDLSLEAEVMILEKNRKKKAKLCERYVSDTKAYEFRDRMKEWAVRRDAFKETQRHSAARFEAEEKQRLEKKKVLYLQLVQGNQLYVDKAIDGWLSGVRFDFDFNLEYEHAGNALCVDLDLPEIEDLPDVKAQKMANGTVKYKAKSQKEKKEDYSRCVFGLAVYFAGNLFNKALGVQEILVSGYTQRRNKTGDMVDDYIYSILFDRQTFTDLDYEDEPHDNCMRFRNRTLQKKDLSFKAIVPYSIEDMQEVI